MEFENNAYFWQKIDTLYLSSDFVLSAPKNSKHPVYDNLIYPVDYGYLHDNNTDESIHMYKGTLLTSGVDGIIICADILKKDIEVKLLVGCTQEEELKILEFLNQTDFQKTIIIHRGLNTPKWAVKD